MGRVAQLESIVDEREEVNVVVELLQVQPNAAAFLPSEVGPF